jgi:hypothetical protein
MHADQEELGYHNHCGKMHRPDTSLYGDGGAEHDYGYIAARFAHSHGDQAADATSSKGGIDMYLRHRLSVSNRNTFSPENKETDA